MSKKTKKRKISSGIARIYASMNNTIISLCDIDGSVFSKASGGTEGFKNSKKSTPFAAMMAAQSAARYGIDECGLKSVDVEVKGIGPGRDMAIRALKNAGLDVLSIRDVTPLPHNGCRPPKRRRV